MEFNTLGCFAINLRGPTFAVFLCPARRPIGLTPRGAKAYQDCMARPAKIERFFRVAATICVVQIVAPAADLGPVSIAAGSVDFPVLQGRAQLEARLDEIAAGYSSTRVKTVAAIQTRVQARDRQADVRAKLLGLVGTLPQRSPLHTETFGDTQADGFRIRKVTFESQPHFPVTALLYLPDRPAASRLRPAILMTPGHSPAGKAGDARTAALFALNGFIVLSYDPIGQGERLQYPDSAHPGQSLAGGPTAEHGEASLQPMLIGDTFARYEIWDAMRGIDFLTTLPEVDPKRIGAFGCSGGGTVTALTSALDSRIAATGVACYITSFDALLPTLGPQDAEQSSPRFLSAGLDFADLIELAAPRPYAVVSTYSDMFPFEGARTSVAEARRFYALFDPACAGMPQGKAPGSMPPIPTEPALNADTANQISLTAPFQFITGPGRHGALTPILGPILGFFLRNLEPGADPDHPILPLSLTAASPGTNGMSGVPSAAFQVTSTGQVASSYPGSATVFTLNRQRARELLRDKPAVNDAELPRVVRRATGAQAVPGASKLNAFSMPNASGPFVLRSSDGVDLEAEIAIPPGSGRHAAVLLLVPGPLHDDSSITRENRARFDALAAQGNVVLALITRPSPPGTESMKAPVLGTFYLLTLRADLVGRTLLGMRVDDVIRAVDFLATRSDVDPAHISAVGSGHLGLVLLQAAALDSRISHLAVDHVLRSYRSLLDAPMPIGAPEDIVPGVLIRYDIPDLLRVLGPRLESSDSLDGSDDLSQTSAPLQTLRSNP
jgi:cephalosporin-C deacetylase-like acetyl esterase